MWYEDLSGSGELSLCSWSVFSFSLTCRMRGLDTRMPGTGKGPLRQRGRQRRPKQSVSRVPHGWVHDVKRTNDSRKAARSKGVRFGRKPKLTDHQQAEALKRLDAGESCRSRAMAVHHATISRLAG